MQLLEASNIVPGKGKKLKMSVLLEPFDALDLVGVYSGRRYRGRGGSDWESTKGTRFVAASSDLD